MKKFIFLGMAIQATIIGLAVLTGSNPKPGQYFFLAGLLILSFILLKLQEKKKAKEKLPKSKLGEHLIDCYSQPFIPSGWSVEAHQKGGYFKFDPTKISLYLSDKQKKGVIVGNDLRKELADKPVMNANILDYLLAHPEFIPEDWKNECVFFWGTIYRSSNGNLCVRCLDWTGSKWNWSYFCLGGVFGSDRPAALAS